MPRGNRRIERRLRSVVAELAAARERVEVAREQYTAVVDDDTDAESRAVVTELVSDRREATLAHRQVEVMRAEIDLAVAEVAALEQERDGLLSQYQVNPD